MAIKLDRYFYVLEHEEDGGQRIRLLGNVFWSTNNRYLLAEWAFENISVAVAQMCWFGVQVPDSPPTIFVNGDRIFGAYETSAGRIWIITESDRSATTILFPHEY